MNSSYPPPSSRHAKDDSDAWWREWMDTKLNEKESIISEKDAEIRGLKLAIAKWEKNHRELEAENIRVWEECMARNEEIERKIRAASRPGNHSIPHHEEEREIEDEVQVPQYPAKRLTRSQEGVDGRSKVQAMVQKLESDQKRDQALPVRVEDQADTIFTSKASPAHACATPPPALPSPDRSEELQKPPHRVQCQKCSRLEKEIEMLKAEKVQFIEALRLP